MDSQETKMKETPITNEMSFNDKDMLMDILSTLKSLSTIYTYSLQEASNEDLYEALYAFATDVNDMEKEVFYCLFSLGWYPLEKAQQNKITKTTSKYDKIRNQLNQ